MTPRTLIIGADAHGSYQMRGVQLGACIGARVTTHPKHSDFAWADVVVLIKRAAFQFGKQAKATGLPLIWDVLDFWEQPEENDFPVHGFFRKRVKETQEALGITTLIGATQAMAEAIGGVYLPHHHRLRLSPAPVREKTLTVGYEGKSKYLGPWRRILEQASAVLGMEFVVNPLDIRELDIVVALRGDKHDGDVCRHWKSGVKLVNAIAAGRPVVTQPSAAFSEIEPVGVTLTDPMCVVAALHQARALRVEAYEQGLRRVGEFDVSTVGQGYRRIVEAAVKVAA
jgi:hypothetical protein